MTKHADESLLRLLPPIRRCRGWRLHAEDGRRFLDLWQDDGRGVLGAKGTGLGTVAKAETDKGLASPLPSIYEGRLQKALRKAYPAWGGSRFYADPAAAVLALRAWAVAAGKEVAGEGGETGLVFDPARRGDHAEGKLAFLERPFSSSIATAVSPDSFDVAWLRLPCPRVFSPFVLLFRTEEEAAILPKETVPALILATAAKSYAELEGYRSKATEEGWKRADRRLSSVFGRTGPYLYPRCGKSDYAEFFVAALGHGLLISPCWELPSLLPGDFDDGELKALSDIRF